jgi:hypothetical protein
MPLYDLTVEPVLDRIATHLATQYGQSLSHSAHQTTNCAYRGNNGTTCAVGCLISDEQLQGYGVKEGTAASELCPDLLEDLHDEYAPQSGAPEFTHALLCAQRYHDGGWAEAGPRYSDRLQDYKKGDPDLRVKILEDLRSRYVTTRIGD